MKLFILRCIRWYQTLFSTRNGALSVGALQCRFYPSCSEYGYGAIVRHGVIKGVAKTLYRILRCNPFFRGGVDYPL